MRAANGSAPAIAGYRTLVYVSFGSGPHADEIRFSVLSASKYLASDNSWKIVIYTDNPANFEGLPVELYPIDPGTAARWKEPHGYFLRSKIKALEASLLLGATCSVLIDGDTYFKKSPDLLFRRVAPGASVMHQSEGPPAPPEQAAIRRVLAHHVPIEVDGTPWGLTENTTMWNSGVVGLHRSDLGLCERTLHLIDQLTARDFHRYTHTWEQLAFSMCLERYSRISESLDVVVHYWPAGIRQPFRDRLLHVDRNPIDAAFATLWADRPRFSVSDRLKLRIKRAGRLMGVSWR